jgi:DNA-binding MarR family transcriptional regulator
MDRIPLIAEFLASVNRLKKTLFSEIQPIFDRHGITHAEWFTLDLIDENPGLSIKDIALTIGMTSSAATQIVNSLFEKGLVERKEEPVDRRIIHIHPSAQGVTLCLILKKEQMLMLATLFEKLTDEELKTYLSLQDKLLAPIQKEPII